MLPFSPRWCAGAVLLVLTIPDQLSQANTFDLQQVDRTIRAEPTYNNAPRYGLLVIGPDAGIQVWVVRDGDVFYVDCNRDRDLTDASERLTAKEKSDPTPYDKVEIQDANGNKYTLSVHLWGHMFRSHRDSPEPVSVSFGVAMPDGRYLGAWGDEKSPLVFADDPEDAPVVHMDGPLQMGFEVRASSALELENSGEFEVKAAVGTKGLGRGAFSWLSYKTIPKGLSPRAILEFPGEEPGSPPVVVEAVLDQRC